MNSNDLQTANAMAQRYKSLREQRESLQTAPAIFLLVDLKQIEVKDQEIRAIAIDEIDAALNALVISAAAIGLSLQP